MYSKSLLTLLFFLILSSNYAQTFEEYKKQEQDKFEAYKQKQKQFIAEMQNEFNEYVKQQDKEFANYLKEEWKLFNIQKGVVPPEIPKPVDVPLFVATDIVTPMSTKNIDIPILNYNINQYIVPSPRIKKLPNPNHELLSNNIMFYGNSLDFQYDKDLKVEPPQIINDSSILNYWLSVVDVNIEDLLWQLENYKDIMNLNGWAYFLLTKDLSSSIYPDSEFGAELLHWVLLMRSGYNAKIGYSNNDVCVLFASANMVYSNKFLMLDGIAYYLSKDLGDDQIRTYSKQYPGNTRMINFTIDHPLNFAADKQSSTFQFAYQQKDYPITIDFNKNVVDFYNDYPQVDIDVYFNAAVSPICKQSILIGFTSYISKMTENEALDFLLKFSQSVFDYSRDEVQFGKEKYLFPEETFNYPASDCEDRSVLFAYLVRELLQLEVIGLVYPGHVSTAVSTSHKIAGDKVVVNNKEYIIADATYKNAPLGMAMPDFRNKNADIILIKNDPVNAIQKDIYWSLANQSGGYRGDILNDLVYDKTGNVYLTGYYNGQAIFGTDTLFAISATSKRETFIVKYNPQKEVVWAKSISGNQNTTGYALTNDEHDNLYIVGTYSGELGVGNNISNLICKENATDVFVARFSSDGQLEWIRKAGLDTYPQNTYFTYSLGFTKDGVNKGTTITSENEFFTNQSPYFDTLGILNIHGSFINSTGLGLYELDLVAADNDMLNVSESLKVENDKLLDNKYEKTIAGVFSVLNHIKLTGFTMLGRDAQKALDSYNPEFRELYPDVYEGISEMNFIYNNDGIISVETLDGKTVILRELKIKNNAKMKVNQFEDGNARLDFLSGVQVGKFFVWFKLNYAKMFKEDGNILFDYDSDHSQKLMNLKDDILD